MRLILGLAALLSLSACDDPWERLPDIEKEVKVVAVDPPKRLRVSLVDEDGIAYDGIYVTKRCNSYERVPVGSRFRMTFVVHRHKASKRFTVEPSRSFLKMKFCD